MNNTRTTSFLMANLGAEIARLYAFKKKGQVELMLASQARAKDIIKTLLNHPNIGNGRVEVEILREIVDGLIIEKGFKQDEKNIQSYFTPFAFRVLV